MKFSVKSEFFSIFIVLLTWIGGIYFFLHFPERVVTHWDFEGTPNGFSGKAFAAFLTPVLSLFLYILFVVLPFLDPKKENYTKFIKSYFLTKNTLLVFLFGISLATGFYNLGIPVDIAKIISLFVGILLIILGLSMRQVEQNFFFGIRTPWTLSSEFVWKRTHEVCSWFFVLFGVIIMIAPYLDKLLAVVLFCVGLFGTTGGSMGYSYFLYKKEQRKSNIL